MISMHSCSMTRMPWSREDQSQVGMKKVMEVVRKTKNDGGGRKSGDYSANEKKAAKEVNVSYSDVDAHTETVNMFVFYKEVEMNQFCTMFEAKSEKSCDSEDDEGVWQAGPEFLKGTIGSCSDLKLIGEVTGPKKYL